MHRPRSQEAQEEVRKQGPGEEQRAPGDRAFRQSLAPRLSLPLDIWAPLRTSSRPLRT